MTLDEIRDRLESDDPRERANGAELLADKIKSLEQDNGFDTEHVDLALQAARDDDPDTKYQGMRALSFFLNDSSKTNFLVSTTINESDQTYAEQIESLATDNLTKSNSADVQSRSALIVARLTSENVDSGASDELITRVTELLDTSEDLKTQQRTARTLANLATYEREHNESVREQMAMVADNLSYLASSDKRYAQSNGLRAIGFMSLSYPEAALPATELHNVVENTNARPKNRSRAIRSLWQIARTHPSVIVPVRSSVEELLHYTESDAKNSNFTDSDENHLDTHAGYIRSNAAMALAQLAQDRPELISESVVERCVELIEERNYALHRAMRLLGNLHETHQESIERANTRQAIETYLDEENQSESSQTRHMKARGYAIWLLTRLAETGEPLQPFETRYLDYLSAIPTNEKTAFDRFRTEALADITSTHPEQVAAHDPSIDWLLDRVVNGSHSGERANAVDALVALIETNTLSDERILPTLQNRVANEPDPNVRMRITHALGTIADDSLYRKLADVAVEESNPSVTAAINSSLDRNTDFHRPKPRVDHPLAPSRLPRIPITEYARWIQATIGYGDIDRHHKVKNGGTGTIYKATLELPADAPVSQTQTIALKQPREPAKKTMVGEHVEEYISEAEKWANVHDHPNIVTVFGWDAQPYPWIAMEYLKRGELGEYTETNHLPISQALWITVCIADALHHAHSSGIYHHDITPANILLDNHDPWPIPKLADWGTAKKRHEQSGDHESYTPGYAAPEQRPKVEYNRPVSEAKTDLYQLATVVYELLAGQKPFSIDEAVEKQSRTPEPPSTHREGIPTEVDELIVETLSHEPRRRPETADEFHKRLKSQL